MSQVVTLKDNKGQEAIVTLAGIPAVGSRLVLTLAGRTDTKVHEVIYGDDESVTCIVRDGFGRI